jgi:hypothetical protein
MIDLLHYPFIVLALAAASCTLVVGVLLAAALLIAPAAAGTPAPFRAAPVDGVQPFRGVGRALSHFCRHVASSAGRLLLFPFWRLLSTAFPLS